MIAEGRRATGAHPTDGRAVGAMVAATLLWGATFVIVRDSLHSISPVSLVAARFGLASVLWALVVPALRLAPATGRRGVRAALVGGLVSGPLTAGGYLFQAIGLTGTSAGSSAFLTATGTLLAAFLAWPLLGLRPGRRLALGILLAMVGSALLGLRAGWRLGAGEAWTLLGAVVYALQVVAVARWSPAADPWLLTAVQTWVTALAVLPFAADLGAGLAALGPPAWGRLVYLVLAGSLLAPLLQVVAQRTLPPGRIGLIFALEPVFALAFAIALGGERFIARWWLGAGLILAAVVGVEWSPPRASPSPRRASG